MEKAYTTTRAIPKDWSNEVRDVQEMSQTLIGIMDEFKKQEEKLMKDLFTTAVPSIWDKPMRSSIWDEHDFPTISDSSKWRSFRYPSSPAILASVFLQPTKVVYNNPYTIVTWADGTVTKAVCADDDVYSEEKGFIVCMLRRVKLNGNEIHNIMNPPTVIRV